MRMDLCVVDKGSVFVGSVNAILTHLGLFRALIVSVMIGLVQKQGKNKRYSKINQNLAQHFKYNGACLSSPPPCLCSQIINPHINYMIFTNQETGLSF